MVSRTLPVCGGLKKLVFGSGLLELYRTSPWLCCKKHCFPGGKCTSFRNASMPRCYCAKPVFIKNRCRFRSFLEVQSSLEMALAGNRHWNGSINQFWNAFRSAFAPHLAPIGLHLGFTWASLGPILATAAPGGQLFLLAAVLFSLRYSCSLFFSF